jgi:hypothetical protein
MSPKGRIILIGHKEGNIYKMAIRIKGETGKDKISTGKISLQETKNRKGHFI